MAASSGRDRSARDRSGRDRSARDRSHREHSALRPLDYVFVLRPAVIVPLWVFFFAGAAAASRYTGVRLSFVRPSVGIILGWASMTALLGGSYLLNQIRDVETDRVNDKLFFLPRGLISMRAAWTELAVVWALAWVASAFLNAGFRLTLLGSLALSVTYSLGPVRAKARCPLDLVWNGLGFGLAAVAAGWATVTELSPALLGIGGAYTLAVAGVTASTTIPDLEGDRRAGLRTTAAVLGERGTSALAIALVAAGGALGAVLGDPLAFFGPLLSLPLLVRAHASGARRDRVRADQAAVAAFALIVAVRLPYMVPLLLVVYFGSRAYYRARFGISYPGAGTP